MFNFTLCTKGYLLNLFFKGPQLARPISTVAFQKLVKTLSLELNPYLYYDNVQTKGYTRWTMQYVYGLSKDLKTCKVNPNERTLQIEREVENRIE